MTGEQQLQQLYDEVHEAVAAKARLELFAEHVIEELGASLTDHGHKLVTCSMRGDQAQQLIRLGKVALGLDLPVPYQLPESEVTTPTPTPEQQANAGGI